MVVSDDLIRNREYGVPTVDSIACSDSHDFATGPADWLTAGLSAGLRLRTVVMVVLDSLRWDTFQQATTPHLNAACSFVERRYSYATWTLPSHACLFAGLLPFHITVGTAAAAAYQKDYRLWSLVFGGNQTAVPTMGQEMSLGVMAQRCGWSTHARVAMPVLSPEGGLRHGFADYVLSPSGSGLGAQFDSIDLPSGQPNLVFINAGETHYPYLLPKSRLPHIPGAHGLAAASKGSDTTFRLSFNDDDFEEMRDAQRCALELADRRIGMLLERVAHPVLLIVTSDHGELFGEEGMFGHGPFVHPLLNQVPLAMGVLQ